MHGTHMNSLCDRTTLARSLSLSNHYMAVLLGYQLRAIEVLLCRHNYPPGQLRTQKNYGFQQASPVRRFYRCHGYCIILWCIVE